MNCGSFRLPLVSTDIPGELGMLAPILGRVGGTTSSVASGGMVGIVSWGCIGTRREGAAVDEVLAGVEDDLLTVACAVGAGCLAVGALAG